MTLKNCFVFIVDQFEYNLRIDSRERKFWVDAMEVVYVVNFKLRRAQNRKVYGQNSWELQIVDRSLFAKDH